MDFFCENCHSGNETNRVSPHVFLFSLQVFRVCRAVPETKETLDRLRLADSLSAERRDHQEEMEETVINLRGILNHIPTSACRIYCPYAIECVWLNSI